MGGLSQAVSHREWWLDNRRQVGNSSGAEVRLGVVRYLGVCSGSTREKFSLANAWKEEDSKRGVWIRIGPGSTLQARKSSMLEIP